MPKISLRRRVKHRKRYGANKKTKFCRTSESDGCQNQTDNCVESCSSDLPSTSSQRSESTLETSSENLPPDNAALSVIPVSPNSYTYLCDAGDKLNNVPDSTVEESLTFPIQQLSSHHLHNYHRSAPCIEEPAVIHPSDLANLFGKVQIKVQLLLPVNWSAVVSEHGLHVMQLSRKIIKCVQRVVLFKADGKCILHVHNVEVAIERVMKGATFHVPFLCEDNIGAVADKVAEIVNLVRSFEMCSGLDNQEYEGVWKYFTECEVDCNVFQECRYTRTLRAPNCERLVDPRTWRCKACTKYSDPVKRKYSSAKSDVAPPTTPNINLTEEQKISKLRSQKRELDCTKKKLLNLQQRMQEVIKREGVMVDNDLSQELSEILRSSDLSPAQSLFLQQQLNASKAKTPCGVRWHPSYIRFALAIYTGSPSTYEKIRDSGMIKLPSQRTLYDYTHWKPARDGVDMFTINDVSKKIREMKDYQKYHVLSCDEMHISRNLVYEKSSGRLIGYTKLSEVQSEIQMLGQYLDNEEVKVKPDIAKTILAYMIKGTANGIKEVVAMYSVCILTKELLYKYTWEVISRLEGCGIAVIGVVCDGCAVNRSFFKMNRPHTVTGNAVVFDTVNKAAPHRILYFFSDVPYLLKTIRNCFANSGKKRFLKKNGQHILWKYITRLYYQKCHQNVRKAYKLNAHVVFLNSYSCMDVGYAAAVLSRTVAQDLEDENWEGTAEAVKFIRIHNDVFDCLNGAHTSVGIKTRNENLLSYTSPEDKRFQFLLSYLDYLEEWRLDAEGGGRSVNSSHASNFRLNNDEGQQSVNDIEDDPDEDTTKASLKQLSRQSIEGAHISIYSFINCTKFLLREGTPFINARIFSQDPLEHYFSRQRSKCGGSNNPNLRQVLQNKIVLELEGHLGVKRRKGNTNYTTGGMVVTSERLPRRKRSKSSML